MGLTYVDGVVTGPSGASRSVRFMVDSGAKYSLLPQGDGHTPVILGEAGDEALLGVVTLEMLGFVLNPFSRTIQPARLLLA